MSTAMTWAESVARPGQSPYRAKVRPRVNVWDNDGDDGRYGLVVTRTHDVDVAVALAGDMWARWFDGRDPLPVPQQGWVRLVPWPDGGTWVHEPAGAKGALPAVWFVVDRWES